MGKISSKSLATVNRIRASLLNVTKVEQLHLLEFDFSGNSLFVATLELPKIENTATLSINPHQVSIGKNLSGEISCINRFPAKVFSLESGKIFSILKLEIGETVLESTVLKNMNLKIGDEVEILIKATDISIDF
jgi:molybdopterin-binding protein